MIRRSLVMAVAIALAGLAAGAAPATAGFVADSAYVRDANSATAEAAAAGQSRAARRRKAAGRCAAHRRRTRATRRASRCRPPATSPGGGRPTAAPPPAGTPVSPSPQTPLDSLAGPLLPVPAVPGPGGYVSIRAREFAYTLSRPVVAAGRVTFELRNSGEDPHDLVVSREGSHEPLASFGELTSGLVATRRVDLGPGRYYLWCALDGHEAVGMKATLRVE